MFVSEKLELRDTTDDEALAEQLIWIERGAFDDLESCATFLLRIAEVYGSRTNWQRWYAHETCHPKVSGVHLCIGTLNLWN